MIDLKTAIEIQLRELTLESPKSLDELTEIITELTSREHDYGTTVYAMSLAANATFNFMGDQLGCSGFQASGADLDFIRRTRDIKGPFRLVDSNDMLFPQFCLKKKLAKFMFAATPWVSEQAKAMLKNKKKHASPQIIKHWQKLAKKSSNPKPESIPDADQIDGGFRFMFYMGIATAVITAGVISLVYYIATNFSAAFFN